MNRLRDAAGYVPAAKVLCWAQLLVVVALVVSGCCRFIESLPGTPTGVSPGTAFEPGAPAGTLTPILVWTEVERAASYNVVVVAYPYDPAAVLWEEPGIEGTAVQVPPGILSRAARYQWTVEAQDSAGSGQPSAPLYFQTSDWEIDVHIPIGPGYPGYAALPGEEVLGLTPTLFWRALAVEGDVTYAIDVARQTNGAWPVVWSHADEDETHCQIPSGVLDYWTQYRWNVRASNGTAWSPFSIWLYFRTPPEPLTMPVLVGPGSGTPPGPMTSSLTPTLVWLPGAGATHYRVIITTSYSSENPLRELIVDRMVSTIQVPAGLLQSAGSYGWAIRAYREDGLTLTTPLLFFRTP